MCFVKPYIVIFGGNTGSQPTNDVWMITLETNQFVWNKLIFQEGSAPSPRLYHACGMCLEGTAQGMMIIFGGRDNTENALNDTWGLRRHRNNEWSWTPAPYKTDLIPKNRFNVR